MYNSYIALDEDQERALTAMLSGQNVFLTGQAGTGKSAVLHRFRKMAGRRVVFLAPTGMAALNIGGSTIHRFFELPPGPINPEAWSVIGQNLAAKFNAVDTIVIDEASMVRIDMTQAIDGILKAAAPPAMRHRPFGGKHVVCVGDFAQLPPVIQWFEERDLVESYGGFYAFESAAWREADFENIVLRTVHRQSQDLVFRGILDGLRGSPDLIGLKLPNALASFNSYANFSCPLDDVPILCTTKRQVKAINEVKDARLAAPQHIFQGVVQGWFERDGLPAESELFLRVGSRVMIVKNGYDELRGELVYANGDIGIITGIDTLNNNIYVALDNGRRVTVGRETWLNQRYEVVEDEITGQPVLDLKTVGTYQQVPLRLAYALTVHKAQGMTLDRVHIELGRIGTFAPGQLYTAISRCRTLQGLSIDRPLTREDIILDHRICRFLEKVDAADRDTWFGCRFQRYRHW